MEFDILTELQNFFPFIFKTLQARKPIIKNIVLNIEFVEL